MYILKTLEMYWNILNEIIIFLPYVLSLYVKRVVLYNYWTTYQYCRICSLLTTMFFYKYFNLVVVQVFLLIIIYFYWVLYFCCYLALRRLLNCIPLLMQSFIFINYVDEIRVRLSTYKIRYLIIFLSNDKLCDCQFFM